MAANRPTQPSEQRIKTVVADTQPVAALGVERCLGAEGFDVSSIVSDVPSLIAIVELSRPTLVVVEISAANRTDWLAAVSGLVERHESRVLAFTSDLSPAGVRAALDSGCLGVVPRTASVDSFVVGAHAVAAGQQHFHRNAVTALVRGMERTVVDVGRPTLSARELGVLVLVADGLTNAVIAGRLGITPATVKTHVERLLRKLGANDRAHAVGTAMRMGILP